MSARGQATVTVSQIAELAGVGASAVGNWRKRFDDFPAPITSSTDGRDLFALPAVIGWLEGHNRLSPDSTRERLVFEAGEIIRSVAPAATYEEVIAAAIALKYALEATKISVDSVAAARPVEALEAAEPKLANVFSTLGDLDHDAMNHLLELVSHIGPEERLETFEWVLNRRGRFEDLTTSAVRAEILTLLAGKTATIFDPAAGEATLLISGARRGSAEMYGQEIDASLWRIAKQRLLLAGLDADVQLGDSLVNDAFPDLRFDTVVCDPPYGLKNPIPHSALAEGSWDPAVVRARTADFAWLQHAHRHLATGGHAYVLLPMSSLTSGGASGAFRAEMLGRGEVEAVVSLPPESSAGTNVGVALWILRARTSNDAPAPVLLADFADYTPASAGDSGDLGVNKLSIEVLMVLMQWREDHELAPSFRDRAAAVPVLDLLAHDAILTPARWITEPAVGAEERERQLSNAISEFEEARRDLLASASELSSVIDVKPQRWISIRDLVDSGRAQVIRGTKAPAATANTDATGTVPAFTAADLRSTVPSSNSQRVDISHLATPPALTQGGDVVVGVLGGKIKAFVDNSGGHFLDQPLQALRVDPVWMDASLLPVFLTSPRNRRFLAGASSKKLRLTDLELPVLDSTSRARLRTAINQLRKAASEADAVVELSERVRAALVSYVEAGDEPRNP